jgi:hypothetical protein
MMASQLAMNLVWGPERILIYNDGNRAFMGTKHPGSLGRSGREHWGEVWEASEVINRRVFAGETITLEDHPWTVLRNGRPEETFFTAYFTPIRDETGAVAGNFVIFFRDHRGREGEGRTGLGRGGIAQERSAALGHSAAASSGSGTDQPRRPVPFASRPTRWIMGRSDVLA